MYMGRDSSVGIVTRYGLDGSGIDSRWGASFSAPVQTGPGAHLALYKMDTGSFAGVKQLERGVDHQPASSAEGQYSYTSNSILVLRGLFF
jgi:hypothetical protein